MFDRDTIFLAFVAGYELGLDDSIHGELMNNQELLESFELWVSELESEAAV